MNKNPLKIGIIAGELSGDILGAGLIHALEKKRDLQLSGVAGPKMIEAGCSSLYDMERLAVMGLIEPLRRLPELIKMRANLYKHFSQNKPDVFIGIDSPDFNLGLELKLRKLNIPVVHYVSPSVWAWRRKRIHKIAAATDLVLTLFPFEADFYHEHNVPACFVGHPLADLIPLQPDKIAARKKLNLNPDDTYIAILPGSRKNEIRYLADVFIQTAVICWRENPNLKFITASANAERDQEFREHCQRLAPELPIQFVINDSYSVMAAADVVLVTSGTATLETMLFKRPMVIAYRMANLTFQIGRRLVKIPHVGLPNILAKQKIVPEFIQDDASPENLAHALLDFLNHPEKMEKIQNTFLDIHQQLRCNANERAADAVLNLLNKK
ncbi:MAG: lipid-A-disaccharide synthase [Gammaproteobacteria bacterium]|nr:lipid-A-disaccharide synthase [Gammaproteobacteria bacterium]